MTALGDRKGQVGRILPTVRGVQTRPVIHDNSRGAPDTRESAVQHLPLPHCVMPRMDGIEEALRLRASATWSPGDSDRANGGVETSGFDHDLLKPIDPEVTQTDLYRTQRLRSNSKVATRHRRRTATIAGRVVGQCSPMLQVDWASRRPRELEAKQFL
jgi:hypothetical protein